MYVEIQARGFELSENLENHIHKKVTHALNYANTKIQKVIVRLFNEDARHNHKSRSCRILVSVKGMPDIITNYRDNNIYRASNAAIKSSIITIKNRLNKIRKLKHIKHRTQPLITT